jgi:peptide/nickel transport system substrate-binding protein
MKRIFAAALATVFVLTGCTQSGGGQTGTTATSVASNGTDHTVMGPVGTRANSWTIPHVLRYSTDGDISSLNPHLTQQLTLGLVSALTMAWLIRWDHDNKPIAELATQVPTQQNGGVSKDGLTITYHMRKGVKWSDGAPFNADDVVFSTRAVLNPANNEVGRSGWDRIAKIDEPDKYTVVYHLSKPYSPFLETFFSTAGANPCLLPKHILGGLPNINTAPYNSLPVGIGPFKYQRWDRASRIVMVPNPLYWRGVPKLQKIVWQIIPDRNTVLTQIQSHQLDLWYPVAGNYFGRASAVTGYTSVRLPSFGFNHLDFNISRPAMSDPAVRQALRLALDRAAIHLKVFHGLGFLQEEPAPHTASYWDPSIKLVPFDIAQANTLLDKAGWVRGPDGIRAKNGVKLNLVFVSATGSPDTDLMIEMIRSWWKQLGISMIVKKYPLALLFAPLQNGGIVYGGKWDVIVFAWFLDPLGDLSSLYACNQIPPNGQNDLRWCNQKANRAMHALYSHYNQPDRDKDARTVMEQLVSDVPTIVTGGREDTYVVNADLRNFRPNAVSQFDDFMNVDI